MCFLLNTQIDESLSPLRYAKHYFLINNKNTPVFNQSDTFQLTVKKYPADTYAKF